MEPRARRTTAPRAALRPARVLGLTEKEEEVEDHDILIVILLIRQVQYRSILSYSELNISNFSNVLQMQEPFSTSCREL